MHSKSVQFNIVKGHRPRRPPTNHTHVSCTLSQNYSTDTTRLGIRLSHHVISFWTDKGGGGGMCPSWDGPVGGATQSAAVYCCFRAASRRVFTLSRKANRCSLHGDVSGVLKQCDLPFITESCAPKYRATKEYRKAVTLCR